jgi:hypothetical protein
LSKYLLVYSDVQGVTMFGLFKSNPIDKLTKEYNLLLEKAMNAQRNGKMDVYAKLSSEADKILKELERLEKQEK